MMPVSNDLGSKINVSFQPVFLSKKLEDELKITEKKPSIVNQQRVVYQFKCSFCDEKLHRFYDEAPTRTL